MFDPDGRSGNWWDNVWTAAGENGTTTFSNFNSDGTWGSQEFTPFAELGTATAFYNFLAGGGTGNYTYWTGGAVTNYVQGNEAYGSGDLNMHVVNIKGSSNSWEGTRNWTDWSATTMQGMFQSVAYQRNALYNRGYWMDNLGNMRSVKYAGRAKGSLIGLRSDYIKTTAKFGKYAERAGWVGYGISAYKVGKGVYEDGGEFGHNAQVATAGAAGGMAGAWAGGQIGTWAGAKIGAGIGVWFEGVGAVPGAAIGGVIGGIAGSILGGYYGGDYTEKVIDGW